MSVSLVSLCSLAVAILVSGYSRINLGIICIGIAFIVGHFFAGIDMASIYMEGFPLNLFFLLLGTTLFSSVAKLNGTYGTLAKQLAFCPTETGGWAARLSLSSHLLSPFWEWEQL